jgi:CheY-like chemotaxis protein
MTRVRVLIVDDSEDAASTLATLMEMSGYEVRTACDGLAALQTADAWQPQIAILDIDMPVMDGIESARQLRRRLPEVILVSLTGHPNLRARALLGRAGFNLSFEKGVAFSAMRRALESAVQAAGLGKPS